MNYAKPEDVCGRTESGNAAVARLNREEEQGRIRGGRKAVEASVLAGAARRTDRGGFSTAGAEEELLAEENLLKKYAKGTNALLSKDDIESMSVKRLPSGAECDVFESKDGRNVIKIMNYKIYSESPLEFLDNRIALHNYLFPYTAYRLIGFTETEDGLCFVTEQPFIQGRNLSCFISSTSIKKQENRVSDYMREKLGMSEVEGSTTTFSNSNYIIGDLHLNNVKEGVDGNLYFIDAVISLNQEHDNLGGYREYTG